jgi:hypothetical protein
MSFRAGDRVRIRKPDSEYTGCRGHVVAAPGGVAPGVSPLGHWVAIDGENGVARPFLLDDLEALLPARVRRKPQQATGEGLG